MNDSVVEYVRSLESRLIGRVFTYDDILHYVVAIDESTGLARMSRRCGGRSGDRAELCYMPIAEVSLRVSGVLK